MYKEQKRKANDFLALHAVPEAGAVLLPGEFELHFNPEFRIRFVVVEIANSRMIYLTLC